MGRPFLNTAGAIIYASNAKITFNIKGNSEAFSFKNRTLSFPTQKETVDGRNKSNTQNKAKTKNKGQQKAQKIDTTRMVTVIHREYDHLLKSLCWHFLHHLPRVEFKPYPGTAPEMRVE